MATTPVFAFRYPVLTDAPNGPAAFQNLATDVENQINRTRYVRTNNDASKTSSTAFSDIPNLSFSVVANAEYLMDGYISYYGLDGVDLKLAFTGPSGMTVSWTPFGPPTSATATAGSTEFFTNESYGDANPIGLNTETDAALACPLCAYFKTGANAGTIQLRFAQNSSNASALIVKRGAWLRLHRVA